MTPERVGKDAAASARQSLGVGSDAPISDLLLAVEEFAAIPVTLLLLPGSVAGAFGRKGDHEFIFINSDTYPVRRRFTLAHEFGHAWLGHDGVLDSHENVFGSPRSPAEQTANAFAANLLAPSAGIERWMEAQGNPSIDLEVVVRLANLFHVSAQTMRIRLEKARYLPKPRERRDLDDAIEQREHRALARRLGLREAADGVSFECVERHGRRLPTEAWRRASRVYEAGLLDETRLGEILGEPAASVRARFQEAGIAPPVEEDLY